MATDDKINTALDVLAAHGIEPLDPDFPIEEMREIGRLREGETVYSTSLDDVFGDDDDVQSEDGDGHLIDSPDERIREFARRLREIMERPESAWWPRQERPRGEWPPPEDICAWYCPIHFFGHGWGIYIREECVLHEALAIARQVDWKAAAALKLSFAATVQRLFRAAFYAMFLHEQFHHKVESLGFRLLVASGKDLYRPYKWNVYRRTFLTPACIEESLANADSYQRLDEPRYKAKLGAPFRRALRAHLRASFAAQPPGYKEGLNFLSDYLFQPALHDLQSRVKDGAIKPSTPPKHWQVSSDVIRAMMDITEEIYVVLPIWARPLFPVGTIDPRPGISTAGMVKALERGWGCQVVPGGKGSHVKLRTPKGEQIILTGNQDVLAPKIVAQAMRKVMGPQANLHSLSEFLSAERARRTPAPLP